ncbi:GntR family transcriptional regulator [Streptomyces sp. NPDC012765]|uniref:GntR family transcriptional regulator n=1 Tax=Streptomyces sp. NPDC012765 TaxID=3155249 RepID=UPI0033FBE3B2
MARRTTTRTQIVAQDLRSKIADERLKPGDKIPSLTELQAEYGVSDTVILEARKVLVAEGLLVARSGDGTYVRARPELQRLVRHVPTGPDQPLFRLEALEGGLFPDVVEVAPEASVPVPASVARLLGVQAARTASRTTRLFRHDGVPVQMVTVYEATGGTKGPVAEELISSRAALDVEAKALEGVAGQLVTEDTWVERTPSGAARVVTTVVLAEQYTLVFPPPRLATA